MSRPEEILEFWFGSPEAEIYGQARPVWFTPDAAFEDEVRRRFFSDFEAAAAGGLQEWEETPQGALALILLLDQCSNIFFRNQAGAFASDARAREVARKAVEKGYDQQFPEVHRWFFYLPFEHSEDIEDQKRSVELFNRLTPTDANKVAMDYAVRHQRVVERFGRFPNRNAALGRESTPAEKEFLASPEAPY